MTVSEKLIYKKISKVMAEVGPVAKSRKNSQQNYMFRGIDDLYEHLQDVLSRNGVFTVPRVIAERSEEKTTKTGSVLIYRLLTIEYDFYAEDGSFVTACVVGEAMDSGDKASNKCMSVAHKYALLQVFAIPTSEAKDPENETHEVRSTSTTKVNTPIRQPPTRQPGFDPNNKEHQDWFIKLMTERGIADDRWDEIARALKGQPREVLKATIEKILSKDLGPLS